MAYDENNNCIDLEGDSPETRELYEKFIDFRIFEIEESSVRTSSESEMWNGTCMNYERWRHIVDGDDFEWIPPSDPEARMFTDTDLDNDSQQFLGQNHRTHMTPRPIEDQINNEYTDAEIDHFLSSPNVNTLFDPRNKIYNDPECIENFVKWQDNQRDCYDEIRKTQDPAWHKRFPHQLSEMNL